MHKYAKPNMHKYAFSKHALICVLYAQICIICWNMHKDKYAFLCKFKYAKICTKYAKTSSDPIGSQEYFFYAFICIHMHLYAKICTICKHES